MFDPNEGQHGLGGVPETAAQSPESFMACAVSPWLRDDGRDAGGIVVPGDPWAHRDRMERDRVGAIGGTGMNQHFQGWEAVAQTLRDRADALDQKAMENAGLVRLNAGQRDSLRAIASRIAENGVL